MRSQTGFVVRARCPGIIIRRTEQSPAWILGGRGMYVYESAIYYVLGSEPKSRCWENTKNPGCRKD